jgi:hypothetical protein
MLPQTVGSFPGRFELKGSVLKMKSEGKIGFALFSSVGIGSIYA